MTSTTAEDPAGRRRWLALYVLCAGVLMGVIDATIVNVALMLGVYTILQVSSSGWGSTETLALGRCPLGC
jgi:hypothetical protein